VVEAGQTRPLRAVSALKMNTVAPASFACHGSFEGRHGLATGNWWDVSELGDEDSVGRQWGMRGYRYRSQGMVGFTV